LVLGHILAAILKFFAKLQKIRFFVYISENNDFRKSVQQKNKVLEILYKEGPTHNFRNFNRLCVI